MISMSTEQNGLNWPMLLESCKIDQLIKIQDKLVLQNTIISLAYFKDLDNFLTLKH